MKTSTPPAPAPKWMLIDAEGTNLGRVAVKTVIILRGTHRASYTPHQLCGDHVIIINAGKLVFAASKFNRKTYHKHSGYLGHMKAIPMKRMVEEQPAEVVRKAVYGMLPTNRLRAQALKRLHVYADAAHEHAAQKPVPLSL